MADTSPTEAIFLAALEKGTPEERAAYLDEACGGDAELRRLVERLLAAHPQVGSFLEQPAVVADSPALDDSGKDLEDMLKLLRPPQEPGELGRLGTYRILQMLGFGGMGMVFLAEDTLLGRKVALKMLLPRLTVSLQARQRFLREARAAAAIEHLNIVPIHHVGEDNDVPFLTMPVLKGQSLDDRLKSEKRLQEREALEIAAQMADGLAAAHKEGLIHRDVKPANVWLTSDSGLVRLLDFGLVRAEGDTTHLTAHGMVVGTPAFMAPEQAGNETIDTRADLFSLGCVLYLMLTGELPFHGDNIMGLLRALAVDTPEEPHKLHPGGVSPDVSAFTVRLLAKKPEERPATARDVAKELRRLAGGGRTTAGNEEALAEKARAMSKAEIVAAYLREEGYKPRIDDDNDVIFKFEGINYYLTIDDEDRPFFRLLRVGFWKMIESAEEEIKVLKVASALNARMKVIKIYVVRQQTRASVELYLEPFDSFKHFFMRCLNLISAAVRQFREAMNSDK